MSHTIQPGQIYRSCRPVPLGPAALRITAYEPGAPIADAVDASTDANCVVYAEDLHHSPTTPTGEHRRDGYALTR